MVPTFHSKSIHRYKSLNNEISNENNIDSETKPVSKEENNNNYIIALVGAVSSIYIYVHICIYIYIYIYTYMYIYIYIYIYI
jgi:hypothetical protein